VIVKGGWSRRALPEVRDYELLAAQWIRQMRAYARSTQLYHEAILRLTREVRPEQRHHDEPTLVAVNPTVLHDGGIMMIAQTENMRGPSPEILATAPLTGRQFEIARLIAAGLSNQEIARRLVLTTGTVGNHVGHILRRLGAKNRAQVATWVTQIVQNGAHGDAPAGQGRPLTQQESPPQGA
jgi:DNA-binding NarL/FixJ family response regulator